MIDTLDIEIKIGETFNKQEKMYWDIKDVLLDESILNRHLLFTRPLGDPFLNTESIEEQTKEKILMGFVVDHILK